MPPTWHRRIPWFAWLLTGTFAPMFIASCALHVPVMDEWLLVAPTLDGGDLGWLFTPHYGHWIPVPKLVLVSLYELGGLNAIRLASGLTPWLASAPLIVAARRARGRAHAVDAVLPLLLAGPPLAFSALHGFDLHFGLDVLLTSFALLALITHARRPHPARLAIGGVLLALAIGCGVDGAIVASALACALPFVDRRSFAIPLALGLVTIGLTAVATAALAVDRDAGSIGAQLDTFYDLLAMPLSSDGGRLARLGATAFFVAVALSATRARALPRRHRPVAWVAGLGTLGALAVLAAIAHVYPDAEPTPALRYASLAGRAFASSHVFLSTISRASGAGLPRFSARTLASAIATGLLVGVLLATPAHVAKAGTLCAWATRLDRDAERAVRSGWTPEEITEQLGDELHPHDPGLLERALVRWLATR